MIVYLGNWKIFQKWNKNLTKKKDTLILFYKVWFKKKFTHISAYYANSDCFGEKSLKSAKSTHAKDSKMVRQVHIVPKLLPGSMINHKNYFWEITKFVKKWFAKKGDLAFLSIM